VHTEKSGGIVKVNLVDPMPLHPLLCYPGTSLPLRAVAVRADGSAVWPLLGGDGEDDGDGDEGEGGADDDADADDDDDSDGDDAGAGKSSKSKKKSGPVSRDEFDAVTNRLRNSDRRRSEAEAKAAALQKEKDDKEREGKPELDNLKKDHEAITAEHGKLKEKFAKLARVNAFLTASQEEGITWHSPKIAQRSADLDDLEIDEDGNVEGIRQAVKDLAKKHKYLVNSGYGDDDDEGDKKPPARRGASGSTVGSTKTGKGKAEKGKFTDEELKRRFPALGAPR
jgi:hypothetical protein